MLASVCATRARVVSSCCVWLRRVSRDLCTLAKSSRGVVELSPVLELVGFGLGQRRFKGARSISTTYIPRRGHRLPLHT